MRTKKPRTKLDKLRRQRSRAVLLLLAEHEMTPRTVAEAAGVKIPTVYKAIEGHWPNGSVVIDFLQEALGKEFADLWFRYPNHAA